MINKMTKYTHIKRFRLPKKKYILKNVYCKFKIDDSNSRYYK